MAKMTLHFTHPRTSESYPAQVAPECPAKLAIERLQSPQTGPFLPVPQPGERYELVHTRTNKTIPASMTMAQAGIVDGDVLQVQLGGQGA